MLTAGKIDELVADHVAEQRAAALLEFSRVLARRPRGARQAQCHQDISAQAREARGDLARLAPATRRATPTPATGLHRDSALAIEYRPARTLAADSTQAAYLRYHMGRLLCDLLGFTGDNPSAEEAYQHKGGHSLWSHRVLAMRQTTVKRDGGALIRGQFRMSINRCYRAFH